MKKYKIRTLNSLGLKSDLLEWIVDGDKFNREQNWITITIHIPPDKNHKLSIPREQIISIEELSE